MTPPTKKGVPKFLLDPTLSDLPDLLLYKKKEYLLIKKHFTNEERSNCIVREKESKRAQSFSMEEKIYPFIAL